MSRQIVMLQASTHRCTSESIYKCSGHLSHNRSIKSLNSRSSTIFGIYSSFEVKLCRSTRWETFWLLSDFALRGFINRPACRFQYFVERENRRFVRQSRGRSKWRILTAKCKPIKRCASMATCYRLYTRYRLRTINCSKMNVMISLLESPHGVQFKNVYVAVEI